MNKRFFFFLPITILVVILLSTCELFFPERIDETSSIINNEVILYAIEENGSIIEINDTLSDLDGFKLEIEAETFEKNTVIEISSTKLPNDSFTVGSTVFRIDSSDNEEIKIPVKISFPIDSNFDLNDPVIIAYDQELDFYDFIPIIEIKDGIATYYTSHFSSHALINWPSYEEPHDIGFVFDTNTIPFDNFSGTDPRSEGGCCFGFAALSTWVFNNVSASIQSHHISETVLKYIIEEVHFLQFLEDTSDAMLWDLYNSRVSFNISPEQRAYHNYKSLLRSLQIGEPAMVSLSSDSSDGGHVIVVYGWDGQFFDVYDSNYPNQSQWLAYSEEAKQLDYVFHDSYNVELVLAHTERSLEDEIERLFYDNVVYGSWEPIDDSDREIITFNYNGTYRIDYINGYVLNGTFTFTDTEITFYYSNQTEVYTYSLKDGIGIIYNLGTDPSTSFRKL